jgi:sec-independent protein translocase protein TatA
MIGTGELIVILCVILVLFGGKKLPELARSLGKGIREFKRACHGLDEDIETLVVEETKPLDSQKRPDSNIENP